MERSCSRNGFQQWEPRPVRDLNRDLSKRYGIPIDIDAKSGGLIAIARALNRGDLLHAQITTLHLQIPDPAPLPKSAQTMGDVVALARQLRASGLLKADWDPLKHPRWPAGSPDSIGGRFAPAGAIGRTPLLREVERHAAGRSAGGGWPGQSGGRPERPTLSPSSPHGRWAQGLSEGERDPKPGRERALQCAVDRRVKKASRPAGEASAVAPFFSHVVHP